jgi:LmbE family N-acetylglucosaminyl deacetylase
MARREEESREDSRSIVLVVLAHPDDPEFFCGGTVARWVAEGREVVYCLLTRGDKGTDEQGVDPEAIAQRREAEERAAAAVLGVRDLVFLGYPDGYLVADLGLRKDVVRVIRRVKPAILITCDPSNYFPNARYINHPDHRAAGQAALEAVFPAARSAMFFPELVDEEGLAPHRVSQVYVAGSQDPNTVVDVTAFLEHKLNALREHKSQIQDMQSLEKRLRGWMLDRDCPPDAPRYVERFKRIDLT